MAAELKLPCLAGFGGSPGLCPSSGGGGFGGFGGWPGVVARPQVRHRAVYVKPKAKAGVAAGRGADKGPYRSSPPGCVVAAAPPQPGDGQLPGHGWGKLQRWVGGRARSGAEGGGGGRWRSKCFWGGCGRTRHRSGGRAGGWVVGPQSPSAVSCGQSLWLPRAGVGSTKGGRLSGWVRRAAAQAAGVGAGEAPDGVHEGAGRRRGWRHGPEPEGGGNQMLEIGHGAGGTEDRAGGWREGPQLRRRDRPGGFDGRCGCRERLGAGRQVERAVVVGGSTCRGGGIGRLRTVPGGDGAAAIQLSRHSLEPWAGEIEMLLTGHVAGGAEDLGRRVAGKGRRLRRRDRPGGWWVVVVELARCRAGGRQVERAGGGRRLKLPGRRDWEAPDGAGRRWRGGHPGFAARSGAVGGGNRNAVGTGVRWARRRRAEDRAGGWREGTVASAP